MFRCTLLISVKIIPENVLFTFRRARRLHRRLYHFPGPNHTWHIDGNDKLVPFGFGIHGCIDGFSRYVVWLNVYSTNNFAYPKVPDEALNVYILFREAIRNMLNV